MVQENKEVKKVGRKPDYKGDGAAAWVNKDSKGNEYIAVKILGNIVVNMFPNKEAAEEAASTPQELDPDLAREQQKLHDDAWNEYSVKYYNGEVEE